VIDVNPFDLTGPAFLLFYVVFSALVIIGITAVRGQTESAQTPRIDLSDPLLIAFLRGGHPEAMRVAAVSLIDRGLLLCIGTRLQTAPHARGQSVRRPVERALLKKFVSSGEADSMFDDPEVKSTCQEYEQTLKQVRLLPDETIMQLRRLIFGCAVLLLGGVGVVKLIFALSRGRTNVAFLIVLVIAAIFLAAKQSFPRLTESGKAMLEDVKNLYSGLRGRAALLNPGGATIEPMMLAAVYGVGALAGDGFAYTKTLFPRANQSPNSSGGSSCGSSCGSSGGSSCGGGCGGGCGGCGG
jgi:uncharacterized protein (TIGR04222 family)